MATQKRRPDKAGNTVNKESSGKKRGLWELLSSLKFSVYILSVMAFFYMLGSLFPQGVTPGEYAAAGGPLTLFTKIFRLLEFYTSPLFLIAAIVLFVNLVVCAYDRYVNVIRPRGGAVPAESYTTDHSLLLTHSMAEAKTVTKRVLTKELRFKTVAAAPGGTGWVVMERGLPYRLLTWLYHIGIIVCCIAITLTYLLAYEDTVTLWPGVIDTLTPAGTGRGQRLLGRRPVESKWSIVLDEFSSEYAHAPTLDFPADKRTRLAMGLGWKAPRYSLEKGSVTLKGTYSALRILKDNRTALDKVVGVNDPMKYGGYTFYQAGFVQKLKVRVDGSPIPLETSTGTELFIPGLKGPVKFSLITAGTLHRLDKGVEEIMPYTIVTRIDKTGGQDVHRKLGRLTFDGYLKIDGKRLTMAGFSQGSVIKYRYDPGVGPLWGGGIIVLIAMLGRFYGAWYRAAYRLNEENGIVRIRIHVSTVGLRADKAKLIRTFDRALKRDDIKPTPVF